MDDHALLAAVLVASSEAIVSANAAGEIVEFSPGAAVLLRRRKGDVVGRPLVSLFAPEDRGEIVHVGRGVPSGASANAGVVAVRGDGSRLIVRALAAPVRDPRGEVDGHGHVLVLRDVTQAVLQHAATAALAADLDPAVALTSVAGVLERVAPVRQVTLYAVDGSHYRRVASSGRGADRLVAGALIDFAGSPFRAVVERRRPLVCQDTSLGRIAYDAILADAGVRSYVALPLLRRREVFATFNVGFSEPYAATDDLVRLLASFSAVAMPIILSLLTLEEQSTAIRVLERTALKKSELFSLIAHDVRTPLAVVAASAEWLRARWGVLSDAEKLDTVDVIVRNSGSVARLVDEGFEVELIDSHNVVFDRRPFSLAAEVRRTAAEFAVTTPGREISVSVEDGLPLVAGDPSQNWRVLTNLLGNAVKFSDAGTSVDVDVTQKEGRVQVAVRDHGRGIDERDVPKLFRKFSRVGGEQGGVVDGAGLGLYICKELVEGQGGRIWVESEPGNGSTFTYALPIAPVVAPQP